MQKKFSKRIRQQREAGSALVMVLLMSTILLILLTTGLTLVLNSQKDTTDAFRIQGQAANVAQAGLQDAVNWFKRQGAVKQINQATHPCKDAAFDPQFNIDPELSATDNSSVGIVKDIQIKGNIYGRYILRKQPCGSAENPNNVRDITAIKGKSTIKPPEKWPDGSLKGEGVVWSLQSLGILYERNNFAKTDNVFNIGPDTPPNRVLRQASAGVEISQLAISTATVPLTVYGTAAHTFGSRLTLNGGTNASAAVAWNNNDPNVTSPVKILPGGAPNKIQFAIPATISEANFPNAIFSVSIAELRAMADNVYNNVNQVPSRLPFSITFLEGNFTGSNQFTNTRPLTGGGLLIVNGDLTLSDGANSLFSGVVFVTGTLTLGRDNSMSGTVVARRFVSNPGSGQAVIEYNSNLVTTVRQKLALYRENNLTRVIREF